MRTATTKARIGLVQPVIEFNGQFYILELRFRMLTWRELARAQGFRDSYEFPTTATNAVRAIGNAVSRRLARALVLATTSQQEDIRPFLENIHDPIKELPEAA
jgi:site-specific DNA-cytosine methylase